MATAKETKIDLRCDNPTCETRLTWIDQKPEDVPDGFFRFTFEQRFVEKEGFKEFAFCCRRCSHEYDRTYVPPLSPREQARVMQANTAADQRVIKSAVFKGGEAATYAPGVAEAPPKIGEAVSPPPSGEAGVAEHGDVIAQAVAPIPPPPEGSLKRLSAEASIS